MPQLIWTVTGDTIPLDPVDCDVYDYFVEQLNAHKLNRYTMPDLGFVALEQELQIKFRMAQELFQKRLQSSAFDFDLDPTNQIHLNTLHQQWVKVHQQFPNIGRLFDTQIPGVLDRINKIIHAIEELTDKFEITSPDPTFFIANTFGQSSLTHNVVNLEISFNNLGKSSYEKWLRDDSVLDTDINNWQELYTTLTIRVFPNQTRSIPVEYQQWCIRNGIPCAGTHLALANFDNSVENLLQYKQMFYKNNLIEKNFIILE